MTQAVLHGLLHVAVPVLVARAFWPLRWRRAALVLVAMNLVDLDHLLATPVYDPGRCSLGFHPLHSRPALAVWAVLALLPATRLPGVGALIHMGLDGIDCLRMG
jgi:hypothetical protein